MTDKTYRQAMKESLELPILTYEEPLTTRYVECYFGYFGNERIATFFIGNQQEPALEITGEILDTMVQYGWQQNKVD